MNVKIEESWRRHIGDEFDKPYFAGLTEFVRSEYTSTTCYPPGSLIFNAFNLCPFDKVKVVIIGQDPYHEPGQAHGLSFSVNDGVPFPPSLVNIFKEIQLDLGTPMPASGNLTRWAEQEANSRSRTGVLAWVTALPPPSWARPKPSIMIRVVGVLFIMTSFLVSHKEADAGCKAVPAVTRALLCALLTPDWRR